MSMGSTTPPESGFVPGETVAPVRVKLSRAKGWRMPPNTVRVARPGKWGNPFKVGGYVRRQDGGLPMLVHDNLRAVLLFRALMEQAQAAPRVAKELRGKNLACWCALDAPCHADVLLELANAPTTTAPSDTQVGIPASCRDEPKNLPQTEKGS